MSDRTCSIEGCSKRYYGRGWCKFHYQRWYNHGDPLKTTIIRSDDRARILSKIDRQAEGCWMWRGARSAGYGYTHWDGRQDLAHRVVYRMLVGEIPEGLELDHTCHTDDVSCAGGEACPHRACVNPDHLEPVAPRENVHRSRAAFKSHCRNGHALIEGNVYVTPQGGRSCRECLRANDRRRRGRRAERRSAV